MLSDRRQSIVRPVDNRACPCGNRDWSGDSLWTTFTGGTEVCQRHDMTSRVSSAGTLRGRLTLLPGLCRLWRDEPAVQLGSDPSRAIIVVLPDPGAARVLDLLDGSRTERGVLRDAVAVGVPRSVTMAMLAALRSANLVVGTDSLVPPS